VAEDISDDTEDYQTVTCLACQQVHLVSPATGKVLGEDDDRPLAPLPSLKPRSLMAGASPLGSHCYDGGRCEPAAAIP
jgi:hypothetical protein